MSIKDLFVKKDTDADDTSKPSTNTSTEKPEEKPAQPAPPKPSDTVTKPGERYTEAELMVRLKVAIGLCLALTLTGIVFVVLYSIIFVTQPLNAISPIDSEFFKLIIPIATFLTGTLSGIMLAGTGSAAALSGAQQNAAMQRANGYHTGPGIQGTGMPSDMQRKINTFGQANTGQTRSSMGAMSGMSASMPETAGPEITSTGLPAPTTPADPGDLVPKIRRPGM